MRSMPLVLTALLLASGAGAAGPAALRPAIDRQIAHDYPALDLLYRDLHAHPELGFQEVRTAGLLAARMRALGFEVTEKVGRTGVVAIFRNGPGPVVLVRTELDALPMEEKTGLPYASRAQGSLDGKQTFVAHSCGHDNHMAWWLGTAQALLALKAEWQGTLMFVAQPSEETVSGARAMIADGLFTRWPKPAYGFAAHVGNGEAGTVQVKDGAATSNSDAVSITFNGRGGHGSMPSATIDPVVMGAHFVSDVQSVISRQKDAGAFGVVTVGSFQAGSVGNIIPDTADLKLSLRSFSPEVRALLLDGVSRTAKAEADMAGAPPPTVAHTGGTGAVVNDHKLATRLADLLAAAGGDRVTLVPASEPGWSASEDFSAFIEAGVPSLFVSVGGYDPQAIAAFKAKNQPLPTNHSPFFAPDHAKAVPTGIRTLTLAVLMVLGKG